MGKAIRVDRGRGKNTLDVFKDIYPTTHTGGPLRAHDQKDWMGIKGNESRLVRCQKCGWICDPDRDIALEDGSFAGKGIDWLRKPASISEQVLIGESGVGGTWSVLDSSVDARGGVYTASTDFTGKYIWAYLWPRGTYPAEVKFTARAEVRSSDASSLLQGGNPRTFTAMTDATADGTTPLTTGTATAQGWFPLELTTPYDFTSGSSYVIAVYASGTCYVAGTSGSGYYLSGGTWHASAYTYSIIVGKSEYISAPGYNEKYQTGDKTQTSAYYGPNVIGGCPACGSYLYKGNQNKR